MSSPKSPPAPRRKPRSRSAKLWWWIAGAVTLLLTGYCAGWDARLGLGSGSVTGYISLTDQTETTKAYRGLPQVLRLRQLSVSAEPNGAVDELFSTMDPSVVRKIDHLMERAPGGPASSWIDRFDLNRRRTWTDPAHEYQVLYAGIGRHVVTGLDQIGSE